METKNLLNKKITQWLLLVAMLVGCSANAFAYDWTSGKTIYFDNTSTGWTTVRLRVGHSTWNSGYDMTKVNGTANLYKYTIPSWGGYSAFGVANNVAWTDGNSIYKTCPGSYNITGHTQYIEASVTTDYTIIAGSSHSTGTGSEDKCTEFYSRDTYGSKKTWKVTITAPSNGTITVSYKDENNSSQSFTSGNKSVLPTCTITVTATPSTGYKLKSLTLDGSAFTSGDTYNVRKDITISAEFTTTCPAPTVTTSATAEHLAKTTVTLSGSYSGGTNVTEVGIEIGGNKYPAANLESPFTVDITGLTENTTYNYKAYATYECGTEYGTQYSFKTKTGRCYDGTEYLYFDITKSFFKDAGAIPNVSFDGGSSYTDATRVSGNIYKLLVPEGCYTSMKIRRHGSDYWNECTINDLASSGTYNEFVVGDNWNNCDHSWSTFAGCGTAANFALGGYLNKKDEGSYSSTWKLDKISDNEYSKAFTFTQAHEGYQYLWIIGDDNKKWGVDSDTPITLGGSQDLQFDATSGKVKAPCTVGQEYTVTFNVDAANCQASVTWASGCIAPKASDFEFEASKQYTGSALSADVKWKDGTGTSAITVKYNDSADMPTAAGEYTLKVTTTKDGGYCAANNLNLGTFTITCPTPTLTSVTGATSGCQGDVITYTANGGASGATGIAISKYIWELPTGWSGTSTTSTIDATLGTSSGQVSCQVQNACGAKSTVVQSANVSVNQTASAGTVSLSKTSMCFGEAAPTASVAGAVLGGGSATWSSSDASVATITTDGKTITVLKAGTTNITYTITGGCGGTKSANKTLTVNAVPVAGTVSASVASMCPDGSSTLSATGTSGATSYQWQKSTTSATEGFTDIAGATSATYTASGLTADDYWFRLVVSGAGDCSNTSNAVKVTVNAAPSLALLGTSPKGTGEAATYPWEYMTITATCDVTPVWELTGKPAGFTENVDYVVEGSDKVYKIKAKQTTNEDTDKFTFTVTATADNGCSTVKPFDVYINAAPAEDCGK